MTAEDWIDLQCHPSARPQAVRAVAVLVRRSAGAEILMTFRLDGDIGAIRVPSPSAPLINGELWKHTCFEAFIALDGHPAYHEFNFAPSREWALRAFSEYRKGTLLTDETMRPRIEVRSTDNRLELDCLVRLDGLSAIHRRSALRIGLSAVVEANDGRSYWALRHRGDRPDFHDPDGFALLLQPPPGDA